VTVVNGSKAGAATGGQGKTDANRAKVLKDLTRKLYSEAPEEDDERARAHGARADYLRRFAAKVRGELVLPSRPKLVFRQGVVDFLCAEEADDLKAIYLLPWEVHFGAEDCNENSLFEWIGWVRDTPNARVLLVGDSMECMTKDSVGAIFSQRYSPQHQMELLATTLEPIAPKLYGLSDGNHERRITKTTSLNPGYWVANALGVPYFHGSQGVLNIHLGKGRNGKPVSYIIHFGHGTSSSRTAGGRLTAAGKMKDIVLGADCYIAGHTHGHSIDKGCRLVVDPQNSKVREEKYMTVLAGSFLEYAGYAREAGMAPLGSGCPRIRLDGKRKDIHGSL